MDFGTRKIRLVQKGGEWREIDITPATPVPPGHDGSQTYSATLRLWNLATVIVASALAFLMAGPAYALIIPCETFDRSNTGAAQPVRDYLDDSKGLFVRVCGGGDHLLYFGAKCLPLLRIWTQFVAHESATSGTHGEASADLYVGV